MTNPHPCLEISARKAYIILDALYRYNSTSLLESEEVRRLIRAIEDGLVEIEGRDNSDT